MKGTARLDMYEAVSLCAYVCLRGLRGDRKELGLKESTHYIPIPMLNELLTYCSLIFVTAIRHRYYYSRFAAEETEACRYQVIHK